MCVGKQYVRQWVDAVVCDRVSPRVHSHLISLYEYVIKKYSLCDHAHTFKDYRMRHFCQMYGKQVQGGEDS